MLDRHGHLHDARGRFATMGALKISATEPGERPGDNRTPSIRRAASAFHPRASASARRDRKAEITDAADRVKDTYTQVQRGTADWRAREQVSWQSPKKRDEQIAKTGNVIMPKREALRREVSLARGYQDPRTEVKRTFSGKPKVIRGTGPEIQRTNGTTTMGTRFRNRAGWSATAIQAKAAQDARVAAATRERMAAESAITTRHQGIAARAGIPWAGRSTAAAKMATPKLPPKVSALKGLSREQAHSQFTLSTPQSLRALALEAGLTPPPKAGSRQLVEMLHAAANR